MMRPKFYIDQNIFSSRSRLSTVHF